MKIVHELNQLEYGGVERVIRNIVKFDSENEHTVIAYKDGPFRKELETVGASVIISPLEDAVEFAADVLHIHSGGGVSHMAMSLGDQLPVIETIHSPIRSPMPGRVICQRVGVTEAVARMNDCFAILNGIDVEASEPTKDPSEVKRELGIPEGKLVIGRAGRIAPDKCLEEWLLACYYLQRGGLDFVPLVVGGESVNDKGYLGKLKLMAASLPVEGVIWAGHRPDVTNYMQVMDVFLYPSPTEGFGLVYVEAMLAGSVVVTYKNDVSMEVAGGYSILTEESIQGLVDGVKKALKQPVRDEIKGTAPQFVREHFSAEYMAAEYGDLYKIVARGATAEKGMEAVTA